MINEGGKVTKSLKTSMAPRSCMEGRRPQKGRTKEVPVAAEAR